MSVVERENELFDGNEYKVDFPQVDEKEVTDLVLRLGGTIKLNRNDQEHVDLIQALTLGRFITLEVSAAVDSKADGIRYDKDDNETVVHLVSLKIQSVAPADSSG